MWYGFHWRWLQSLCPAARKEVSTLIYCGINTWLYGLGTIHRKVDRNVLSSVAMVGGLSQLLESLRLLHVDGKTKNWMQSFNSLFGRDIFQEALNHLQLAEIEIQSYRRFHWFLEKCCLCPRQLFPGF